MAQSENKVEQERLDKTKELRRAAQELDMERQDRKRDHDAAEEQRLVARRQHADELEEERTAR